MGQCQGQDESRGALLGKEAPEHPVQLAGNLELVPSCQGSFPLQPCLHAPVSPFVGLGMRE